MANNILSSLNGFFTRLHRLSFEIGLAERKELSVPVLSVGNISFGGTGKTPFCQWLCEFLQQEKNLPAILTRGYGRENEEQLVVVHDGRRLRATTQQAGDEPVLLGKNLKSVPIVACADRYKAGRFILKKAQVDCVVLDDGMQHYRLARQGEIVLLDSSLDYFSAGAGELMREPLSALNRAHLIVLTRCTNAQKTQRLYKELKKLVPAIPIVRTKFVPGVLHSVATDLPLDPEAKPEKVFLASGIGNPKSFEQMIKAEGFTVLGHKENKDHARYSQTDVRNWMIRRKALAADAVIVTEKDAVKLAELFARLKTQPKNLFYCPITLQFLDSKDQELAERVVKARLRMKTISGLLS